MVTKAPKSLPLLPRTSAVRPAPGSRARVNTLRRGGGVATYEKMLNRNYKAPLYPVVASTGRGLSEERECGGLSAQGDQLPLAGSNRGGPHSTSFSPDGFGKGACGLSSFLPSP